MSLKFVSQIPYGNGRLLSQDEAVQPPLMEIAAEPSPEGELGWFHFRLTAQDAPAEPAASEANVRLRFRHAGDWSGGGAPINLTPVCRAEDQDWARMRHGLVDLEPDGQTSATWMLRRPTSWGEIALSFPFGRQELRTLLQKSGGYWKQDSIGLTANGFSIPRLCNDYARPGAKRPGFYLVARERPFDMPASWVLEGAMQEWSRLNSQTATIWAMPFAHPNAAGGGRRGLNEPTGQPLSAASADARALRSDLLRWSQRCTPALILELRASGACDIEGVHAVLPGAEARPEAAREAEKWANIFGDALASEFSASEFKRQRAHLSDPGQASLSSGLAAELAVPCLTLAIPHCEIRKQALTRKSYRQIGKLLATCLLKRLR